MGRSGRVVFLTIAAMAASGGCQRSGSPVAPAEPLTLPVSNPVAREITDYVDFTGSTQAVGAVDVRPRVTGYLMRAPFREGSEVKQGDLLFEIDPRPYQAQLDQAQSQVKLNEASLKLAKTTYERDRAIAASVTGGVSQQQLDQDLASVDEATARLQSAKASTEVYKLNLSFTKVTSPIDGLVSRYYLTVGNLVNQDQTLLTTVVSLEPMFVYFDMDEPTLLRIRKAINEGKIQRPHAMVDFPLGGLFASAAGLLGAPTGPAPLLAASTSVTGMPPDIPVFMGLQAEGGFPHRGTINFVNNQFNPATGSISIRGLFPNPRPEGGTRLLSPGMFVRVRLPIGEPHEALLVIDRAIGSDQGQKFVYVVDAEHKVQYRRLTTGALQEDGLRVITEGLKAADRVLVGGLPQVRPNMQIQPESTSMPTLGQAPEPRNQESGVRNQGSGGNH